MLRKKCSRARVNLEDNRYSRCWRQGFPKTQLFGQFQTSDKKCLPVTLLPELGSPKSFLTQTNGINSGKMVGVGRDGEPPPHHTDPQNERRCRLGKAASLVHVDELPWMVCLPWGFSTRLHVRISWGGSRLPVSRPGPLSQDLGSGDGHFLVSPQETEAQGGSQSPLHGTEVDTPKLSSTE